MGGIRGEILGLNYFNNVVTGNYGGCATGAVFFEGYTGNENLYNNLFLITYTQENAGIVNLNGFNIGFYNNTIIGNLQTGDQCFDIGYSSDSSFPYTPSISFENNVVENCSSLVVQYNTPTLVAWDHNGYGELPNRGTVVYNGTWYYSLASWQAACACDSHSVIPGGGIAGSLNIASTGVPQAGSPVIGAGVNLTSLGTTALDSDSSAGGTRMPSARPASAAWDIGAFSYSSGLPAPPTSLGAVAH